MEDYVWSIITLRVVGDQNQVREVVWSAEYNGKKYVSSTKLTVDWDSFIPYTSLSEQTVINWVKSTLIESVQKSMITYFENT